ncbi:MAG: hypothetical protein NTV05_01650 [Acidobacteria bacterium]|nr:hypothetical protein [Acidobacteriota bacterium]
MSERKSANATEAAEAPANRWWDSRSSPEPPADSSEQHYCDARKNTDEYWSGNGDAADPEGGRREREANSTEDEQ